MSLGATMAGVKVVAAVESDPHAAATYAANFPSVQVENRDIRTVKGIDLPRYGNGTVLFGGPPCQGFSTSNQRTRSRLNSGNWLFEEFLRIAFEWQPDWIVFENVKGIIETEGGLFIDIILDRMERAGYSSVHGILNASDFGVPQRRSRFFVVCSRNGQCMSLPAATVKHTLTLKDAIADLPSLPNGARVDELPYGCETSTDYAQELRGNFVRCTGHLVTRNSPEVIRRYSYIKPGQNWESIPEELMKSYSDPSKCHTGIYRRLESDKPSVVIGNYRKNMLIHPSENRGLSVREAARIQSFPDRFRFHGSIGFQQQQVGNAVPPLMAKAVFAQLLTS
jgi:DNA (cytosine-5)-methyltransferase 1